MDVTKELDPRDYVGTLDILRQLDFLKGLPEEDLKGILFTLHTQSYAPDKKILFQGEIANCLFILRRGGVRITTKNKGQVIPLAELKAPMYFGEISLLQPTSATATVTASEEGADCIVLAHDFLNQIAKKIPDIRQRIQTVVDSRVAHKKKAKEDDDNA